jgi:hypothetical protein
MRARKKYPLYNNLIYLGIFSQTVYVLIGSTENSSTADTIKYNLTQALRNSVNNR